MLDDMKQFVKILTKRLDREQLQEILEAVTAEYEYGSCPLCGCPEIPIDKDGNELEEEDTSVPSGYREVHDDDCPVRLIEASFSQEESRKS